MSETKVKEIPNTPSSEELFALLAMVLKKLGGEFEIPRVDMEWAAVNIDRFQIEGGPHGDMVRLKYTEAVPESVVTGEKVN